MRVDVGVSDVGADERDGVSRGAGDSRAAGQSPGGGTCPGGGAPGPGECPGTGVEQGVGVTALLVAAARAIETHRPDALARDPYAEHFVRAASASAHWPVHPRDVPGGDADPLWGRLGRYFALRTRALDDQLLRAVQLGARQVVLLGAGLDSRAFRLEWPPGCTVYEVDRPEVLAFKHRVLDGLGALSSAPHRTVVEADFRTDWSEALTDAGFRPGQPTAWLAEGLLLYLPSAAERDLIAVIDQLSAAGSTLAYEVKLAMETSFVLANPLYLATRDRAGIDLLQLFDAEPRPDTPADLAARGWSISVHTPFDFTRHYGRGPLPEPNDALAANRWVFAARP